jgi:hypothetical protein
VTDERRTVHIGLDLTLPAGSPLYAPFDGVVHGFEDATARLDYGPLIVLRHEVPRGASRFRSTRSTATSTAPVSRAFTSARPSGRAHGFAAIGAPPENGDWWPHVHVQVITDLLDVPCNFNGVAPASQRRTWLALCPDPNLLLGIPPERFARHATTDALLDAAGPPFRRQRAPLVRQHPLQIVRGWMQYLFDETGRTYLDAYNNVPHVGHAHPRVVEAVAAQLACSTPTRATCTTRSPRMPRA